jgi:hypothetical protein
MLLGSDINGVGSYEVNLFNLCPHDQKVYIKIVRILLGLPGTHKSCLLYSNAIYVFDFMFALCVYSLRNNLIRAKNGPSALVTTSFIKLSDLINVGTGRYP